LLDKPSGMTSRKAGAILLNILNRGLSKKDILLTDSLTHLLTSFGHMGTLDPMASGLLPIAFGQASKMIPFIPVALKKYAFELKFGFETDTLDITGKTLRRAEIKAFKESLPEIIPNFIGKISQVPPDFSAVHIDGTRAYELARRGKKIEMKPREIEIYSIEITDIADDSTMFVVSCSTGTYVRSLGRDIAVATGNIGTVSMIRRLNTNGFDIKNAQTLDFFQNSYNNEQHSAGGMLLPIDFGLDGIPVCNLETAAGKSFANGGFVDLNESDGLRRIYSDGNFIGIGKCEGKVLKPMRVII